MTTKCAWCGKNMGGDGDEVTHSICDECAKMLDNEIKDYLNRFKQASKL